MKTQGTSLRESITNFERKYFGDFLATEVNAKGLAGLAYTGIVMATPFIGGCVTLGSYGDLNGSRELTKNFERGEIKSDHNYWIAGTNKKSPDAILGLDKEYTLDSRFWYPLNSQDKTLRGLVENMNDEADNIPYGADVLDHNKNDIGDWYSTANSTTVKIDGRIVQVYTPRASGAGGSGKKGKSKGKGSGGSGR